MSIGFLQRLLSIVVGFMVFIAVLRVPKCFFFLNSKVFLGLHRVLQDFHSDFFRVPKVVFWCYRVVLRFYSSFVGFPK